MRPLSQFTKSANAVIRKAAEQGVLQTGNEEEEEEEGGCRARGVDEVARESPQAPTQRHFGGRHFEPQTPRLRCKYTESGSLTSEREKVLSFLSHRPLHAFLWSCAPNTALSLSQCSLLLVHALDLINPSSSSSTKGQ
jgi:hypothetical protein